jgi:hypothetical protein
MTQLQKLKDKWILEGVNNFPQIDIHTLEKFEVDNDVHLPTDLKKYFILFNGTNDECTDELYEFYAVGRIKRVQEEFNDWRGIPNYQALLDLEDVKDLFVFANYSFNLFVYAIRLSNETLERNEVYVICGEDYKKISDTFSEFLELYLNDSIELQLNKEKN